MNKKESKNPCDCIKFDVCHHYGNIMNGISGITEMRFGGGDNWVDPIYTGVDSLIKKHCKYREQNKKKKQKKIDDFNKNLKVREFKKPEDILKALKLKSKKKKSKSES